jgi:hypothetical protein
MLCTRPGPVRPTGLQCCAGGPIPGDENQDHPLNRWLATRLANQTGDKAPVEKGARRPAQPARKPAPVDPSTTGMVPLATLRHLQLQEEEEDADDPATVLTGARPKPKVPELDDPETVQLSRMPVSFISESVMDPATVVDNSAEATRWRAVAGIDDRVDELPPARLPSLRDRSVSTFARELPREEPAEPTESGGGGVDRNVILVGLMIGAMSGFVLVLVLFAWFAGRV